MVCRTQQIGGGEMKTFLEHTACDILAKYGNNLSRIAVVFPNKRASLFLNEALAQNSVHHVLAPRYYTISELFALNSELEIGDSIELVSLLCRVYCQLTGITETLDHFFSWGELMIKDFDDIDKHLADARRIFSNVSNLRELDDLDYLTEEQKQTLRAFFPDFEGNSTRLQQKFLQLWSKLYDIYEAFNQTLREKGIAYEGALYRDVRQHLESTSFPFDTYIFIGFNHLLPVEEALFRHLKKEGKARFYWDYDITYNHEDSITGGDIRRNLTLFPNELAEEEGIFDHLSKKKDISIISTTTDNIQTHYIHQWLTENKIKANHRTVIVLADERLLPAVVHALPKEVEKINITIAYPLAYTDIPDTLQKLMQQQGYRKAPNLNDKICFLSGCISELLREDCDALRQESLFRTYTLLNRLIQLQRDGWLDITEITFQKLLNTLLGATSVPFHGEPVEGIQIMGVLETRNLDFEHMLVLSCNEGTLPKTSAGTSFIPHFLRKVYGLTTQDNSVGIFSYYFYRMIQRCDDVSLMWNSSTEGTHRGEMSRFMLQMLTHRNDITQYALCGNQIVTTQASQDIPKTEATRAMLDSMLFSATRLAVWLRCQKRFYFQYIKGLKEYEDPAELGNDNRIFGTIFHEAVRQIYSPFKGRQIQRHDLERINDATLIQKTITGIYLSELKKHNATTETSVADGLKKIHIHVLTKYVQRLIELDMKLAPFTIISLETEYSDDDLQMGGIIDRLDMIQTPQGARIRVVDFKTGGSKFTPKIATVEDIFDPNKTTTAHGDYYLQTFLYSIIIDNKKQEILSALKMGIDVESTSVSPALLFIQHAGGTDYDPTLKFSNGEQITDIRIYKEEFTERLKSLIAEIKDVNQTFHSQEQENQNCSLCPYRLLCWR